MASAFENLLSRLIVKDEIHEIGCFNNQTDVCQHISKVSDKINELQIDPNKSADFLLKTVSSDIRLELSALPDYASNCKKFDWIKGKLQDLFGKKQSAISPYLSLFKIEQKRHQSTRDFLSTVRVEGIKILHNISEKDREKMLVRTFIHGLRHKKYSKILDELAPTTLDEAFNLIKKEPLESETEIGEIDGINSNNCRCEEYRAKIDLLVQKISDIEGYIKQLSAQRPSFSSSRPNVRVHSDKPPIRCYNCNATGHLARQCRRQPTCRNCGRVGHIAENCRNRAMQRNNVRQIEFDNLSYLSEPNTEEIQRNGSHPQNIDAKTTEQAETIGVISSNTDKGYEVPQNTTSNKQVNFRKKFYPREIEAWTQYIVGQGNRPKKALKSETVISSSRSELARHKPIVRAKINNMEKKILVDSGADCNVIDEETFQTLCKSDSNIRILRKNARLSCANSSPLNVVGYTVLALSLGGKEFRAKFVVVEKIFPRVILGIRTMKRDLSYEIVKCPSPFASRSSEN